MLNMIKSLQWWTCAAACTVLAAAALITGSGNASAQADESGGCGNPFTNHYGPFDYRTATVDNKKLVENIHFTPGVESLTQPATTTTLAMAGDVGYTLHVFPNHHRALLTMARLGERHKTETPPGAKFTVECYFRRAVQFRPDDTVARSLYADYLGKKGRKDDALVQLRAAVQFAGDNPFSHHNIGLLFLELGDAESALAQAHKASDMGFPRKTLENKLKAAGKWREP